MNKFTEHVMRAAAQRRFVRALETLTLSRMTPEELVEMRELIEDVRNAAQDGRLLADRYAELLRLAVAEYCDEFEKRAEAILQRFEVAEDA